MWLKNSPPYQHYPLAAMVGKDGKLYFRLVDVGALLGRSKVYEFAKRFDNLVIKGAKTVAGHKRYPVITQRPKLVTPDVVFNILNAELSSLPEFCHQSQWGFCSSGEQATCLWKATKRLPSCIFKILPSPIQSW
ncbi:uncharacterized protein TNIN_110081 [Trichonephila inaurata madagascariensis]|uniref:Uncharacterized protein n=1 Tax=Trichonephila inaurata madagascariensis TaxID=2747483 RepID=A0A8X7C6H3_9ARAC|nr:uncharacterized protein TNIN_110081 [Trichonephila inaurata madagascariensis]